MGYNVARPLFKSEIKLLAELLKQEEVDVDPILKEFESEHLEDNSYYKLLRNYMTLTPVDNPSNAEISILIGENEIVHEQIEKVLDCLILPLRVKVDFMFIVASATRYN